MPSGLRDRLTRPLVRRLRKEYRRIRVDIADGTAHENRAAALEGLADIAVIHEFERGLPLNSKRLYFDPICLVGPRTANFNMDSALELKALGDYPLLLIQAPNQIRWTVDAALRKLKRNAQPVMEVGSSPVTARSRAGWSRVYRPYGKHHFCGFAATPGYGRTARNAER